MMRGSGLLRGAVLALLLCGTAARAAEAPPALPDTPAGQALRRWLDGFNSGDGARLKELATTYHFPGSGHDLQRFRSRTGGFELPRVLDSQPRRITFRLKEKASATQAIGRITVGEGVAPAFDLKLHAVPPGDSVAVDAATRARFLDGVAAKLTEYYVYPEGAKKMVDHLRALRAQGHYDAFTDAEALVMLVDDDLADISHDGHLRVFYSARPLPPDEPDADPLQRKIEPEWRDELLHDNCAFPKVERLDGNIGYVKIDGFAPVEVCADTVKAAMGFVANADAVIFDLRENHGGEPDMVGYVLSFIFDKRTHLNDIYIRKTNKTMESWTKPELGQKLGGKPVFVLTSHDTFSGGEEFSYDVKCLKRATLVGETTGGGAHPAAPHRIDDHFAVVVPGGRPINPITKGDWEGTGVAPDVAVPADAALATATKLARERLAKSHPPAAHR